MKNKYQLKISDSEQNLLMLICLVFGALFLIWKAQRGYIFNDEPFILTLGHRMIKGDKLFLHEWNMTQLISCINIPVIKLYTFLTNTTTGLILFVRYVYVAMHLVVSGVLYFRVRRYGITSVLMVMYYLMFTPLDTMSITYNVVALIGMTVFSTSFLRPGNLLADFLTGLVLACGVLVHPYSALVYFVYAAGVSIMNLPGVRTKKMAALPLFEPKRFLGITLGCLFSAVCFFIYLCIMGLSEVINGLAVCFSVITRDGISILNAIAELIDTNPLQTTLGITVLLISLLDKDRNRRKDIYFSIQAVIFVLSIGYILRCFDPSLNRIMLPMSVLGAQAYVLTKEKNCNVFLSMWVTGILYAICANETSDTGALAISSASTISGMGSIILISLFWNELQFDSAISKRWIMIFMLMVIFAQSFGQLYTRYQITYWDYHTGYLDTKITVGAAKGIITTQMRVEKYEDVYEDLQTIKNLADDDDHVLIVSLFPSAYLDLDMHYGTDSAWTYLFNEKNFSMQAERLEKYYTYNPEKIPEVVYVLQEDMESIDSIYRLLELDKYDSLQCKQGTAFFMDR